MGTRKFHVRREWLKPLTLVFPLRELLHWEKLEGLAGVLVRCLVGKSAITLCRPEVNPQYCGRKN